MKEETMPSSCCEVCNAQPSAAASILTCTRCGLHVHAKCFGLDDVGQQQAPCYVCSECLVKEENMEYWGASDLDPSTICALCSISLQSKRGMKVLMRNKRRIGYAHALCGLFLPGAILTARHVDISQVKSLQQQQQGDVDQTCVLCSSSTLAASKCSFPECAVRIHASCASLAQEEGFELNFATHTLSCPCHSTFAMRFPQRAEAFLKRITTSKLAAESGSAPNASSAAILNAASPAPFAAGAAGAARRKPAAPKRKSPAESKICDPTWINRRVSLFLEETVGTAVAILPEENKFVIALDDDGQTRLERAPQELSLIPIRPPGCFVCKNASSKEDVLLCDLCDVEHHLGCAKPPLAQIPEGKWFCEDCTKKKKKRQDELAAQQRAQAKAEKLEKKQRLEKEEEEEYNEKRKRKRSSLRLKTKEAAGAATLPALGNDEANNGALSLHPGGAIPEEHEVDFETRFPELTVEDWTKLWLELFAVQRAELQYALGTEAVAAKAVRCRPLLLASKCQNAELPLRCVEAYVSLADRYPVWTTEEERIALETCLGGSRTLMQVDFMLPPLLQQLSRGGAEEEEEEGEGGEETSLEAAIARCEDALLCVDLGQLSSSLATTSSTSRLARVLEKLRLDCERVFSRATLPAFRARELFRKLQPRLKQLRDSEFALTPELAKKLLPQPRKPLFQILTQYETVGTISSQESGFAMRVLETNKRASEPCSSSGAELAHDPLVACKNCTAPLQLGVDLEEREMTFGFDQPTRKFLDFCLESVAGIKTARAKRLVVDGMLRAHITSLDFASALEASFASLEGGGDFGVSSSSSPLDMLRGLQAIRLASQMFEVPIRAKGAGITATRGIPAHGFVQTYLGEVYPPWRWFERQDNVKLAQNKIGFKPALPELLPTALERHEDDARGYDIVFVDPTVRGNFASRLQHSCAPNCKLRVVAVDGQYQLALYALRDIVRGEELTLDKSKPTEEEQEFRNAICVCGAAECRGAFLTWNGTNSSFSASTTDVLANSHGFLDRVSLLLLASMTGEPAMEGAQALLRKFALRDSVLNPETTPAWMQTWAAYILRFVEHENEPAQARRQNLAVTINKIAYFLRTCETNEHPLRCLEEKEVVEFLWSGAESIARRAMESCNRAELPHEFQVKVSDFCMSNTCQSAARARELLRELSAMFWAHPHTFCENCGDVLLMYAMTETWFTATQYQGFKSTPLAIRNVDIGRDMPLSKAQQLAPLAAAAAAPTPAPAAAAVSTPAPAASAHPDSTVECTKEQLLRIHYSISGEKQRISKDQPLMRGKTLTVFSQQLPGTVQIHVHRDSSNGHCSIIPPGYSPMPPEDALYFSFFAYPENVVLGNLAKVSLQCFRAGSEDVATSPPAEYTFQTVRDTKLVKYLVPGEEPRFSAAAPAPATAAGPPAASATSSKKEPVPPALKPVFTEPKKYQAGFAWGQLVGWWKQTVSDPSASLSAERRGSLSLPDIETCFNKEDTSMERFQKCRRDMLKKIKEKPDGMWPVTWPYSFRNKEKIYGSPWFDDALETARAGDFVRRTPRANAFLQIVHEHLTTHQ